MSVNWWLLFDIYLVIGFIMAINFRLDSEFDSSLDFEREVGVPIFMTLAGPILFVIYSCIAILAHEKRVTA